MIPPSAALALALAVATDDGVRWYGAEVVELPPEAVSVGQSGELSLLILESLDLDAPLLLRLDPSRLDFSENRLDWDHVVDPRATQPRMRIEYVAPAEPGRYRVTGMVEYLQCDETMCRAKRAPVGWEVMVLADESASEAPP